MILANLSMHNLYSGQDHKTFFEVCHSFPYFDYSKYLESLFWGSNHNTLVRFPRSFTEIPLFTYLVFVILKKRHFFILLKMINLLKKEKDQ